MLCEISVWEKVNIVFSLALTDRLCQFSHTKSLAAGEAVGVWIWFLLEFRHASFLPVFLQQLGFSFPISYTRVTTSIWAASVDCGCPIHWRLEQLHRWQETPTSLFSLMSFLSPGSRKEPSEAEEVDLTVESGLFTREKALGWMILTRESSGHP